MSRPHTQREIKKFAESKKSEPRVSVTNIKKSMVILSVREPGSDFYIGEKSIYINPGKTYTNRKSLFNEQQISNLKAKGEISVLNG
jgi:hypothetical protein